MNTDSLLSKGEDSRKTGEGKKEKENLAVFRNCDTREKTYLLKAFSTGVLQVKFLLEK